MTRRSRAWRPWAFAALALLISVGACKTPPPLPCPQVIVLDDASRLTRFADGPGRDLLDVAFKAEMPEVFAACRKQKQGLEVTVAPTIAVTRGAAAAPSPAEVPFFVSVLDPSGAILNKQQFGAAFDLSGNRSRVMRREDDPPVTVLLPPGRNWEDYRIYVGFQLTPEELQFNEQQGELGRGTGGLTR
jgi:hypothetical protein